MKARTLAIVVLLLATTACAKDTLDGEVTAKNVEPGFTYVQVMPICTNTNKTTTCQQIPYIITVPTCHRLTVRTDEGKSDDGCVSEANFNRVEIGDDYLGEDLGQRESKEPQ